MIEKLIFNMTVTKGFLDAPIFGIVSEVAESIGVRAFVTGGYVRDCFLGRTNDDIDIVVEGSGIALRLLLQTISRKLKNMAAASPFSRISARLC